MKPYTLYYTQRSPFARRVHLALKRLELPFDLKAVEPFHPTPEFLAEQPLGTVPCLITPEGERLPDSTLALEVLHERHGSKIWPEKDPHRTAVRAFSMVAMGGLQNAVSWFVEKNLRKTPDPAFVEDYEQTLIRALRDLETRIQAQCPMQIAGQTTIAAWDLGAMLEYIEFRHAQFDWKSHIPSASAVLSRLRANSDFIETRPRLPSS